MGNRSAAACSARSWASANQTRARSVTDNSSRLESSSSAKRARLVLWRQAKHFFSERIHRHKLTLPGLRTCDFLGTPTRASTGPPDKVATGVPQISLGPARAGLRLLVTFQAFAQLADLVLNTARIVHRCPGFVVPVRGVSQVAFDAVDEPVNPPGDRVVQILYECVSARPVVGKKALDRVRKLLGVRSFHRPVATWCLSSSPIS